jgi:hypothetical protein
MDPMLAMTAMKAASGAMGGLVKGVSSLFGGRKRRERVREAQQTYNQLMREYEGLDTSNLNADIENPFEDMTVNQQQAQFKFEKADLVSSDTLSKGLQMSSGSGVAGVVQAMMQARTQNIVNAAVDIGNQEYKNQMNAAQTQIKLDQFEAQGAEKARQLEYGKTSTLLGMAGQELAAANKARQDATRATIDGFTQFAIPGAETAMSTDGFSKEGIGNVLNAFKQ